MGARTRHRALRSGTLAGLAILLWDCYFPLPLKVDDPEPFPPSLMGYLVDPSVERPDLAKRLGPPDATRDEGRLWIYGRARVVWRDYANLIGAGYIGAHHYLLARFGDDGRLVSCEEIVDAGCTPSGLCLEQDPDPWMTFPGPVEADRIVVYQQGRTLDDVTVSRPDGTCRMVVFLRGNGQDERPLLAGLPGGTDLRTLTTAGVYLRDLEAGTHQVELFDWFRRERLGRFLFGCGQGETVCLSVSKDENPWSVKVSTTVTSLTWEECVQFAGNRRLVLD